MGKDLFETDIIFKHVALENRVEIPKQGEIEKSPHKYVENY